MPIVPVGRRREQVGQGPFQNASFYDGDFFKKLALLMPDGAGETIPQGAQDQPGTRQFGDLDAAMMGTSDQGMNAAIQQSVADENAPPKGITGEDVIELNNDLMGFLNNQNPPISAEVLLEGDPNAEWTLVAKGPNVQGQTAVTVWKMLNDYNLENSLGLKVEIRTQGTTGQGYTGQQPQTEPWQVTLSPNKDKKETTEQTGLVVPKARASK